MHAHTHMYASKVKKKCLTKTRTLIDCFHLIKQKNNVMLLTY